MTSTPLTKGNTITYDKEIMFKGTERIESTIIGVTRLGYILKVLAETGDVITIDTREELN
jgi:hypothetical protein